MIRKGRNRYVVRTYHGESHPRAKLSADTVREMRSLAKYVSRAEMGRRYGVCPQHVSRICRGTAWKQFA
jgi:hypothetical protein